MGRKENLYQSRSRWWQWSTNIKQVFLLCIKKRCKQLWKASHSKCFKFVYQFRESQSKTADMKWSCVSPEGNRINAIHEKKCVIVSGFLNIYLFKHWLWNLGWGFEFLLHHAFFSQFSEIRNSNAYCET